MAGQFQYSFSSVPSVKFWTLNRSAVRGWPRGQLRAPLPSVVAPRQIGEFDVIFTICKLKFLREASPLIIWTECSQKNGQLQG